MAGDTARPREVAATEAVERAQNGELPLLDEHILSRGSGSFRSTLPITFFRNTPYTTGDVAGAYADFEQGILVLDYQQGGEYER